MRNAISGVGLVLVASVIVISPLFAAKDLDRWRTTLERTSDDMVRAALAGDSEKLVSLYTDDAVYMPSYHEMLEGQEAIARYQEEMDQSGIRFHSMDFTILELWQDRDHLYEIGKYGLSMTVPGTPVPVADNGKFMTVWAKQRDGSLKIKAEIWNSDLDPWAMQAEGASKPGKCGHSSEHCLNWMAKSLKGRGMIGLDGEWVESLGGYRVDAFAEGTHAEAAGAQRGDLLIKVNGIRLSDQPAYAEDAAKRRPGQEATITVLRDGAEHTMTVTLIPLTEKAIAEEIGRHMLEAHLN
jgi:ketosteroid isomerase-like protein